MDNPVLFQMSLSGKARSCTKTAFVQIIEGNLLTALLTASLVLLVQSKEGSLLLILSSLIYYPSKHKDKRVRLVFN